MSSKSTVPKPKPAPLAMVPHAAVSHALTGTIEDKIKAAAHIAANVAALQLNGWDSTQKCLAAFWLADGKGEHPAVFIENHYVMMIKGRMSVTPRWQYVVRKLTETIPGFKFRVIHNTNDAAKVQMSDGVNTHEYEYTVDDAKRVGLFNRSAGNAWTEGSTREMCLARAVKRCGDLMGLGRAVPWIDIEMDVAPDEPIAAAAAREISEAVVVDDVPGPVSAPPTGVSIGPSADREPKEADGAAPDKDWIAELSLALRAMYGKQSKDVMLQKASLIYNEMQKEAMGVDPQMTFTRADQIAPAYAQQMVEYLEARKGRAPEPVTSGGTDAPPAPEAPDAPPAPEVDSDVSDDYTAFMTTVQRARKLFNRRFIVESPPGSGKFWLNDQVTFAQAGKTESVKLMVGGEIIIDQPTLRQLNRILTADCDAAERGRP